MKPQDHLFYARKQSPSVPAWIIAIVILALLVTLIWFYGVLTSPAESQRLVRPEDKKEAFRRLQERNMPLNTPVEISDTDYRYRFQLNGKWERL